MGKWCNKCGGEIPRNGMTMYEGKKVCDCDKEEKMNGGEDEM